MAEEQQQKSAGGSAAKKKEKPPAIEDKPLPEFLEQHVIPSLRSILADQGIENVELKVVEDVLPFDGADPDEDTCIYLLGEWDSGVRRFGLYFLDNEVTGRKIFTYVIGSGQPSTVESFMIDERKITLELLVMYVVQRLNAQKWLTGN